MQLISQYKGLKKEIYVLFFGRIVTSLGSMIWPVLTLILTRKLGMSATEVAIFTICTGAVYLPANLVGGKLADRFNKKNIIVTCDLISISFYIVCAFIPLTLFSIILLIIASALQSLEYPSYNSLIADLTLSKDREKAYSLTYLGMNIGLVAAPTIAGLLFENHLNLSFLISGLSIAISTFLIAFLIRDITPVKDDGEIGQYQEEKSNESIFSILRQNKLIILYALMMTLYWSAYNQYGYLMPLDMGQIHGDKGAVIFGSISSLNSIVVVLFTPIITKILTKTVSTQKAFLGQVMLFSGYIVFILLRGNIPFYYVAMFLFTLGEIVSVLGEGPYLTQRVPASHRGRVNGFISVTQSVTYGISSLVVGLLYDNMGPGSAWSLVLGFLAVAMILGLILIKKDKKRYPALYN